MNEPGEGGEGAKGAQNTSWAVLAYPLSEAYGPSNKRNSTSPYLEFGLPKVNLAG
jgi:hypothetical protein